ncbi:hypothetical protein [Roseivirga misakiensis]|uniref:Uncharacterized protein n=1 Tax=Roseivirga misakiensis TaxID=1563681 RepID=A0A1E5T4D2_9BACT|nr:hypothetical protein [Roseivirga misakiensis]OEK06253.1 hypothetical protein BFP71_00835 [Roseivirga misakiensis]
MTETVATIFLIALAIYVLLGLFFYAFFIKSGVHKIDSGVKEAPIFMKVLILPGTVALWPILLKKIRKGEAS